jgi:hypothetical protein
MSALVFGFAFVFGFLIDCARFDMRCFSPDVPRSTAACGQHLHFNFNGEREPP